MAEEEYEMVNQQTIARHEANNAYAAAQILASRASQPLIAAVSGWRYQPVPPNTNT